MRSVVTREQRGQGRRSGGVDGRSLPGARPARYAKAAPDPKRIRPANVIAPAAPIELSFEPNEEFRVKFRQDPEATLRDVPEAVRALARRAMSAQPANLVIDRSRPPGDHIHVIDADGLVTAKFESATVSAEGLVTIVAREGGSSDEALTDAGQRLCRQHNGKSAIGVVIRRIPVEAKD